MVVVRTSTFSKKFTGTTELEINYDPRPHSGFLSFRESFTIPTRNGRSVSGVLEYNKNSLNCCLKQVVNLHGEVTMKTSNETKICQTLSGEYTEFNRTDKYLFCRFEQPALFLEGKITIWYEPAEEKQFEENLSAYFNILKYQPGSGIQQYDIKLVVQYQEFEFNMGCLSKVSSAFREMIENSTVTDRLEIPGESVATIQTFKQLLDGTPIISEQITLDLYEFADKFDIQPLVKACGEYFAQNITRDNMFDLAIIANRVADEHLLKRVAKVIYSNRNDAATRNIIANNREIRDLCATLFLAM